MKPNLSAYDHVAFGWVDQPALELDIHQTIFKGAAPQIMGESPYLNSKPAGLSLALTKKHLVKAVFLYAGSIEGFQQYAGPLPAGIQFSNSRTDVLKALGKPDLSGNAGGVGLMAIDYSFDRYEHNGRYLHFQYFAGDAAIRLVTIGKADD